MTLYRKLDVAKVLGSVVTAAKDGAEPDVPDGVFANPSPSTVVLNIEDNAYSEASSKSLASSTDENPINGSKNVKIADEPPKATDDVESVKDEDEKEDEIGVKHKASVAIGRLIGTVYIHTVVESPEKYVVETGTMTKAEIRGLGGVKYASIDEETVGVIVTTAVVDIKALTDCPDGKKATGRKAVDGTNKVE